MSGESYSKGKKRKKSYYKQSANKINKRNSYLGVDMKGFLITCNKREHDGTREAYSLLNEYADKLYGPEQICNSENGGSSSDSEEDMEKAFTKEVGAIKDMKTKVRRFQAVESGANNCIFIKTILKDPTELAYSIFTDIHDTKTAKSRYVMRLLPVAGTCKTQEEKIQRLSLDVLSNYFKDTGHSYSIHSKIRNNNKMARKDILRIIGTVIQALNPCNSVNLKAPEYVVNVDIIKGICMLSVLKNFFKFRKYNLQEVAQNTPNDKPNEFINDNEDVTEENTRKSCVMGEVVMEENSKVGSSKDEQVTNELSKEDHVKYKNVMEENFEEDCDNNKQVTGENLKESCDEDEHVTDTNSKKL